MSIPDAPWIGWGKGDLPSDGDYCHICDCCGEEIEDNDFYEVGCRVLCKKCFYEENEDLREEDEADDATLHG